jgi:predicted dehydrogenase
MAAVEVEDLAVATLQYDNGALGSLFAGAHLAGAQGGRDEHFDIFGTQGQLKVPDVYGAGALQVFLRRAWGDTPAGVWHSGPAEPVSAYVAAVEALARAVQRREPAPTSGVDARRVLAIVLAIYRAATEQRTITLA